MTHRYSPRRPFACGVTLSCDGLMIRRSSAGMSSSLNTTSQSSGPGVSRSCGQGFPAYNGKLDPTYHKEPRNGGSAAITRAPGRRRGGAQR